MNVDEFLTLRGTNIASAMEAVDRRFGLAEEHLVLAVGSLVEDLGNSTSDLDIILIAPEDSGARADPATVTVTVGRCLVDVRVLPIDTASVLLDRFEAWTERRWDVTHKADFSIDERTVLHRLRHGQRLFEGRRSVIDLRFPSVPDLARLKLHVARQKARTIQVDMVGNREAGDCRSLTFAAQELLGQAVDALVAAYGLTNPLVKWRSRLLDLLPEDWEDRLMLRPGGVQPASLVWRLHRAPEEPDEIPVLRHAFAISTFARAAFACAESALLGWSAGAAMKPREHVASSDGARALPCLDFDVDFAPTARGAVLARLNEFGRQLELTSSELALALLFDGRTSESEASLAVYGSRDDGRAITHLLAKVHDAQLSAAPLARTAMATRS